MISTMHEARIEFEEYGCKTIEDMLSRHKQLSERIGLYKKIHPHLVHLLEKRKIILGEELLNIAKVWSESNYSKVGGETFQMWLKEKHPGMYQREYEPKKFEEIRRYYY